MTEPEPTATMRADLRAVDEALESGAVTAADSLERELQELGLALRAEAPEPAPEFAARLRARVQEGFPREHRLPRRLPKLRRPPLPVLAGVAAALMAIAVAVSLTGDDEEGQNLSAPRPQTAPLGAGGGGSGSVGAAPSGARALEAAPPADVAPAPPIGFEPGRRERRIERSASLTLAAPDDRLDRVADDIVRLTDRLDGFVLRSSLSTGDGGITRGDFELRIPATRLQSGLAELSKLAEVRARTQSGQDVTREFVSAADRLEGARAERRSLLRRLERARDDAAAEAIRRRLDLNAGEIRGLRGQVRDLRTRTDYATVTVTLQDDDHDGGAASPGGEGLGGALDDAVRSFSDSLEIAIRVLGVALPLGLLAGATLLGARAARRRRREAALG